MSDQNDDFDQSDNFDTDLGFEEGGEQGGKANNKALFKVVGVAVGMVAVVVAIFMFGGGSGQDTGPKSEVAGAPVDPEALPAQKEPTPEYRQALESYNQQIIEEAKETGQSVVPIPVDPARQQLQTKIQESQEDPAERFRRIQEEYRRQQEAQLQQKKGEQSQEDVRAESEIIQSMAQAMSTYLNTAMSSRQPRGTSSVSVSFNLPSESESDGDGYDGGGYGDDSSADDGGTPTMADAKVLLSATTIEYGQLLIEANTDAPGPVLAMVASGKFSGARLLGSFQKTDEYLTINFNQMVTKEGKSIPIQAMVLDPKTTLPGVITEIDHKYIQRYLLPAAADFISGVGDALAETQQSQTQSDTSTTTSTDEPDFSEAISQGISDSFDGLADAFQDSKKNVQPMLRVAAGTPIGILFTQDVLDPESVRDIQDQMAEDQSGDGTYPQSGNFPSMMIPYGMVPYGMTPGPNTATASSSNQ